MISTFGIASPMGGWGTEPRDPSGDDAVTERRDDERPVRDGLEVREVDRDVDEDEDEGEAEGVDDDDDREPE